MIGYSRRIDSVMRGFVNTQTRSITFHRSPWPCQKLSTTRKEMYASSQTHALR